MCFSLCSRVNNVEPSKWTSVLLHYIRITWSPGPNSKLTIFRYFVVEQSNWIFRFPREQRNHDFMNSNEIQFSYERRNQDFIKLDDIQQIKQSVKQRVPTTGLWSSVADRKSAKSPFALPLHQFLDPCSRSYCIYNVVYAMCVHISNLDLNAYYYKYTRV